MRSPWSKHSFVAKYTKGYSLPHRSLDLSAYSLCITTWLGSGCTNCSWIYFSSHSCVSSFT